jgi:hypothetical protein
MTYINYADKKNRIFFCGRSQRSILGGLLYLLSFKHGKRIVQILIAYTVNVNIQVLSQSVKRWQKFFPELFKDLYEQSKTAQIVNYDTSSLEEKV